MVSRTGYRLLSVTGTLLITAIAVTVANLPPVQQLLTVYTPLLNRLSTQVLTGKGYWLAVFTASVVVASIFAPLYKPQPRRIPDLVLLTHEQVLVSGIALAAIGYFDYTYRLPRATLLCTVALLFVWLPMWFIFLQQPRSEAETRRIIVGDDAAQIHALAEQTTDIYGYLMPPSPYLTEEEPLPIRTDGLGDDPVGDVEYLGGLSRLDDILVANDIDTAILAFSTPNRAEFFGILSSCYEHGVKAKIHSDYTDSVLTSDAESDGIVDIDLEPWDWQDYLIKRTFDICFAGTVLLVSLPIICLVAAAVKLDSPGPVFYKQRRTAELGDTFGIYKFRTMLPNSESANPGDDTSRITRVGAFLRRTHLDEIPQLWAILTGRMSVVGPRAAWVEEETVLETDARQWRKRWFVKPGLTGLAQINNVTSESPEKKLHYDLEYIRNQSLLFDFSILARQLSQVVVDVGQMLRERLH